MADSEQLLWIVVQLVRAPLVTAEVASSCLVNLTGALIHKLTVNLKSQLTKAPKPNAHWMFSSYFRIGVFLPPSWMSVTSTYCVFPHWGFFRNSQFVGCPVCECGFLKRTLHCLQCWALALRIGPVYGTALHHKPISAYLETIFISGSIVQLCCWSYRN